MSYVKLTPNPSLTFEFWYELNFNIKRGGIKDYETPSLKENLFPIVISFRREGWGELYEEFFEVRAELMMKGYSFTK